MIFMTPNTISRPAAMMKSMAAVVTASRATVSMVIPSREGRGGDAPPRRDHRRSGLARALRARIDVLEALDDLHAAVGLDLAEIHGQRRMALLVHLDGAARTLDRDLGQRLQNLVLVGAASLLDGSLVGVDRFVLRNRQIVRRLQLGAVLLEIG